MEKINLIKQKAKDIRISIIEMLFKAKSGHSGGPLGMADIYATLYFSEMKHDPKNPFWELRDRLVLSNGHTCPVLYASMAHAGYFDLEKLFTLRQFGSVLQGHPHREFLPSLETSSGPLGSGLSQAVGMAISDKREYKEGSSRTIYCLISDGEQDEGQIWEAALLAPREKLDNLIVIVDRNYIQIDGNTENILPLDPMDKKWEAFNWHVQTIDGHNIEEIISAIALAKNVKLKPSIIIAKTIPGKGVSFMENDYTWHGKAPNVEEAEKALNELKAIVV
ncbi:transketolase [Candidatus Parcubacteria bacterium]|nr:transketolase [Candidatus Parcubacteria bacterium]